VKTDNTGNSKRALPFRFLIITLVWTWAFWALAIVTGDHYLEFPPVLFAFLGFLGPLIVAVAMVKMGYWDSSLSNFMQNCFDPRRLNRRWYLYIIGLVIVLVGTPVLILAVFTGHSPAGLINFTPTIVLVPAVLAGALEEPGWRGYAQKALQGRMSVLASSLVIGLFWALWHWPLFFLPGYYHATMGFASSAFWFFNLSILVGSVIYGWIYNRSGRIAFAAVFYHALGNLGRMVLSVDDAGLEIEGFEGIDVVELVDFFVEALVAVMIILAARELMLKPLNGTKRGNESEK